MTCEHLIETPDPRHPGVWLLRACGKPGLGVTLPTPAGRPPARGGCYCAQHGGLVRSQAEAEQSWDYLAPASVGDAEAVQRAGTMQLDSQHVCIVLRQERGAWLAWRGIGGRLVSVHHDQPKARQSGGRRHRRTQGRQGTCAFASRELALQYALDDWRRATDQRVAEIRAARGGTLDWGMPVRPAAAPQVLDVPEGQTGWEVAVRQAAERAAAQRS